MYSPFVDLSPYEAVYQIPTQRRRTAEPIYYVPSYHAPRRNIYPERYMERIAYPQYYRSPSPDEYRYHTRHQAFEPEASSSYLYPRRESYLSTSQPTATYRGFQPVRSLASYDSLGDTESNLPYSFLPASLPEPKNTYYSQRRGQGRRMSSALLDLYNQSQLSRQPQHFVNQRFSSENEDSGFYTYHSRSQDIAHQQQKQRELMIQKRKAQLEEQRRAQAIQHFILNRATKVIQRQWRLYHQKRRVKAAETIVRFIKSRREIRLARKIMAGLRQLRSYDKEIDEINERQMSEVFNHPLKFNSSTKCPAQVPPVKENQSYLGYEDTLLKMLMHIDGVDSLGSEIIRESRKSLVKKVQSFLDKLDNYKNGQYNEFLRVQANQDI